MTTYQKVAKQQRNSDLPPPSVVEQRSVLWTEEVQQASRSPALSISSEEQVHMCREQCLMESHCGETSAHPQGNLKSPL